jgi:hypothetical protein
MKFEIMYNENTQLWKMEKLLTAAGYRKTDDCHWVQIYENRNGDTVVTQREDTSVCVADPVDRLARYLDPQPEPAAQPAQPAQKPSRVSISPGNSKMERYDYRKAMKEDILDYISDEINLDDFRGKRGELEELLNDDLWICDDVTGNESGSYFFSTWKAEEAIAHNWDLLEEAMQVFEGECNPIAKGAEWCDVTIRCYLLGQCIAAVLDDLSDELEEIDEEA